MVGLLALGVVSACMAAGPPRLEPVSNGKWPKFPRGAFGQTKVVGGYAYACSTGLAVFDVRDPTNCVQVGLYNSPGRRGASSVALAGPYAYVTGPGGLTVMDVSDPLNCKRVGSWTNGFAGNCEVAVAGDYAYVGVEDGLRVMDVSNPTNCVWVGRYNTLNVHDVAVVGNHAFLTVAAWTGTNNVPSLHVIDVSNPTNCVLVGAYPVYPGYAAGATVAGNRIYLANAAAGIEVLRSLPGVQFTFQVDGTPGMQLTVEAATNLVGPVQWTPLLTTNVASMPFDFVDYDVTAAEYPQKFYGVRQP